VATASAAAAEEEDGDEILSGGIGGSGDVCDGDASADFLGASVDDVDDDGGGDFFDFFVADPVGLE
jgi:hypothetical protein